jgi:hypothetical protein
MNRKKLPLRENASSRTEFFNTNEIYRQPKRLRLTSWQCADNPSAPQNIKASNSGVKYMIPSSEKLLKFAPVAVFLASDQSA